MKHSNQEICDSTVSHQPIKEEDYLINLERPNTPLPSLFLDDCETFSKEFSNELTEESLKQDLIDSGNDELLNENLKLGLENDSDGSDDTDSCIKNAIRKNKRKSMLPQRAMQSEVSQTSSVWNSSESSQDMTDHIFSSLNRHFTDFTNSLTGDGSLPTTESGVELPEDDIIFNEFKEEGIFKDLQDEVDGENFNEEIIDNVKEEWRAHWGIKCNMCEQVFPYRIEFDKHYIESYNLHPVYTCTFCNKTAEKYSSFRSHCYRHITEGRYKCEVCSKGFSLQSMLHVHMISKHTGSKPFICEECGKSFVTKPGLRVHAKKHKTEQKEDYPCVECGKVLHTRGGLTSHMNVHRLGRRFMCDVCGKTFTQKVNMQQHVKQHTGDKPHECDKCGKAFAERSHLARHYSLHSDQRPYKCDVCQKMYKTERCLKVHSLVHAAERPFLCEYCNKGFLSSTKLKQHSNIHTGERPYKCKYCERTFTNYPNWMKHIRRRHKVDHKTGELLQLKAIKDEEPPPPTPAGLVEIAPAPVQAPVPAPSTPAVTVVGSAGSNQPETLLADICLSKADELILQQSLLNLPLIEEKIILPQQIDLLAASNNGTMSLIMPYFQAQFPSHQTIINNGTMAPIQLSDIVQQNTFTFCE